MKEGEFLVPFWERKKEDSSDWRNNKKLKRALTYIKAFIYSFNGFLILWSFFQSAFAPYTRYNPNPGMGLEFGYLPWKGAGSPKYDLGSWSIAGPKYHAFYEPATVYGPFLSWFVYPVAKMFVGMVYFFDTHSKFLSNSGLDVIFAMIILMFIVRFISFWPTLRSSIYMDKQISHQPAIDLINAKYNKCDPSDKQSKLQKHQEITAYNIKHNLKPFAALETAFISTPIFWTVFRVITISRPIKFTILFGLWDLSRTPSSMVFNHLTEDGWLYLILCLIIIPVNFFSQKLSAMLSRIRNPQLKKADDNKNSQAYKIARVQKIMTIVFLLFTFFWSTSLAIYYFFNSIFTIFQNLLIHWILVKRKSGVNIAQLKLQKLGIDV